MWPSFRSHQPLGRLGKSGATKTCTQQKRIRLWTDKSMGPDEMFPWILEGYGQCHCEASLYYLWKIKMIRGCSSGLEENKCFHSCLRWSRERNQGSTAITWSSGRWSEKILGAISKYTKGENMIWSNSCGFKKGKLPDQTECLLWLDASLVNEGSTVILWSSTRLWHSLPWHPL